ncbi:LytTR family DNA-binding domain-containing protein [Lactobacillus sp. ESL0677]|uniref:LytTR family DNA-binding domain-containing protein n=1 Tax=Lactobacillus sp. ESL0677 TaxID=2983208 RepID=UPI0023F8BDC2|nr:LytTR family DNA-binding domain-containing protein [Lactobacillus sp. ESL0677]WEV36499.1 LytTR family DNA-binding domain-containing protein [Lactobacillus sp. ESL0677]
MQIKFQEDSTVSPENPTVIVKAAKRQAQTLDILQYLEHFAENNKTDIIPIKAIDQIVMVKSKSIILVDIVDNSLLIYTTNSVLQTKETLSHFSEKLNHDHFLQISRHAIINVDHLLTLEDSFSGNLTAKLTNDIKTSISRKYVKSLMTFLGI